MKTDVIGITPNGDGVSDALRETEKAAAFRGLDHKQTLRLRLLAEEMTGMLKTIVGPSELRYWVESNGSAFSLHLASDVKLDAETRKSLLEVSTSGENAAAKGFMGKLRDVFVRLCESNDNAALAAEYGYAYVNVTNFDASMDLGPNAMLYGWSLSAYRSAVESHGDEEKWDELEKSITAKLADEVKIFIRRNTVEMVIEKAF